MCKMNLVQVKEPEILTELVFLSKFKMAANRSRQKSQVPEADPFSRRISTCGQRFMTVSQRGHEICLFKVCFFWTTAIAPPVGQSM